MHDDSRNAWSTSLTRSRSFPQGNEEVPRLCHGGKIGILAVRGEKAPIPEALIESTRKIARTLFAGPGAHAVAINTWSLAPKKRDP